MDMVKKDIVVGDTISAAIREGNTAALRIGVVQEVIWQTKPNITQTPEVTEADPEPVLLVAWDYSNQPFLPLKATKIAAGRVYRHDRL